MKHDPTGSELRRLLDRAGLADVELTEDGRLPALAGSDDPPQTPVGQPLGGATVSGTEVTVDTYVNPPTVIPGRIRNLVAANQGYFAEDIFATPGFTVQGGALIYEETFPEDFFVPEDQSFTPRAPGTPAPRLGSTRREPKVARPESMAGSIEVTDEARRRNQVLGVRRQFLQAANTIADRMQSRAMQVIAAAVSDWGRQLEGEAWRIERATGLVNVDPFTMPHKDIALVQKQFQDDRAGVMPDTIILNTADNYYLTVLYSSYPNGGVDGMLRDFGITQRRVSPLAPEGAPYFLKRGQVGSIVFEKPLDQEKSRDGEAKTDIFTLDMAPLLVADDASAILQLTGVSKSS
jgi:hypothetical protein